MLETKYSRHDLLTVAITSPKSVLQHDKHGWLSLFSRKAVVEDPVGAAPHHRSAGKKTDALEKFYDTFIAPNQITFSVFYDIVIDDMVVRDVDIEIMASSGLITHVHSYAMYELIEEDEQIKIARLAAYWELFPMVKQVLGSGIPGLKMVSLLGYRMLRIQGLSGVMGYLQGFSGIGRRGKDTVGKFVSAFNRGDTNQLTGLFSNPSKAAIELPAGKHHLITALLSDSERIHLTVSDLISAGMTASFRFDVSLDGVFRHGIGLAEFSKEMKGKLTRIRFFWNDENPNQKGVNY